MQSSSVNTSAAFQPPKRRKISSRSYVMPSQKKEAPAELKSFELVLLQYADPQTLRTQTGLILTSFQTTQRQMQISCALAWLTYLPMQMSCQ